MNITVYKGFNSSLPPLFRAGVDVDWYYEISLNSEYYLVGEDQYDWNKLIGIKERYLQPLFHSFMIGFRWDIRKRANELNFYKHIEGKVDRGLPLTYVNKGEKFFVGFKKLEKGTRIFLIVRDLYFEEVFYHSTGISDKSAWYLINTWFGGNNKSPVNYRLQINRLK
jgi:hypothetical protein